MNVEWIKIQTDMFQNRKIRYIETLPQGDTLLVIWCKLLCLAGQVNDYGRVYVTRGTPYTKETLAIELNKSEAIIERAMSVFESLSMIEYENGVFVISKWGEYQNIDGLEKIKEQNRLRKQKQRERGKTAKAGAEEPEPKKKEKVKHKYGSFNNVLLTDEEYKKLEEKYSDLQERIERLSLYISSSGKSYKSHYATIISWAAKDEEDKPKSNYYKEKQKKMFYTENRGTDYDALFGGK